MEQPGPRPLAEVAMQACGVTGPAEGYGLVTTDAPSLGSLGIMQVVKAALGAGRIYRTAAELAGDGAGLQVLVLVRLGDEPGPGGLWIVDGWSLIRGGGQRADLRGALLRGAQLSGARLAGANLEDSDLCGADLGKADLPGASLRGA